MQYESYTIISNCDCFIFLSMKFLKNFRRVYFESAMKFSFPCSPCWWNYVGFVGMLYLYIIIEIGWTLFRKWLIVTLLLLFSLDLRKREGKIMLFEVNELDEEKKMNRREIRHFCFTLWAFTVVFIIYLMSISLSNVCWLLDNSKSLEKWLMQIKWDAAPILISSSFFLFYFTSVN